MSDAIAKSVKKKKKSVGALGRKEVAAGLCEDICNIVKDNTAVALGFLYSHFKGRRPQRLEPARKKSLDIFDTPGEIYIHYCCLGFQPARK